MELSAHSCRLRGALTPAYKRFLRTEMAQGLLHNLGYRHTKLEISQWHM